jgi:hypothetical protein
MEGHKAEKSATKLLLFLCPFSHSKDTVLKRNNNTLKIRIKYARTNSHPAISPHTKAALPHTIT